MKTVTVTIKDDNKVAKSLMDRIKLLENVLRAKKDNSGKLVEVVSRGQTQQMESLKKGIESLSKSFSSSVKELGKDKTKSLENAFNKRAKFLESILKRLSLKPKVIVNKVSNTTLEKKVDTLSESINKARPTRTIIRESFITQIQGSRVSPSPS